MPRYVDTLAVALMSALERSLCRALDHAIHLRQARELGLNAVGLVVDVEGQCERVAVTVRDGGDVN